MSNQQETSKIEAIGCLGIIGLVVFAFVMPTIVAFIKFLMGVAFFVAIGYVAYKFLHDPIWTERFERWLDLKKKEESNSTDNSSQISDYEKEILQSQKVDEITEELNRVKNQINDLNAENERLRNRESDIIRETLETYGQRVEKQKGEQILNDLFDDTSTEGYRRSAEHEKQEYELRRKEEQNELDFQRIELNMDRKFFDLQQDVTERSQRTEQEVFSLRQEVMDGFTAVAREFLGVHQEITSIKGYVTEKFAQLETMIVKEIASVRELVIGLEQRVYREIGEVKVQFGQEVLRLDQQQLVMLGKLKDFNNTIGAFHNDMHRLRMDAERFEMRGQDMLNKTITVQQRHQVIMKKQSLELSAGLQKMAMHDQKFANKVGNAQLMLEQRSSEINLALKDMAHERIGINMLRQDYQQRDDLAQERLTRKEQEIRNIKTSIQQEMKYDRDTSRLQHQLNMAIQQKNHLSNMASLVHRENSLIRTLSKRN